MNVTYSENKLPYKVGEYDGRDILNLGAYRVEWPDGFCVLISHNGTPGTVGASPLDLDDASERQIVLDRAEEIRREGGEA